MPRKRIGVKPVKASEATLHEDGYTIQVFWNDVGEGWFFRVYDWNVRLVHQEYKPLNSLKAAEEQARRWIRGNRVD